MDKEPRKVKLNARREKIGFDSAAANFVKDFGESFAILYTPKECLLLKVGKDGIFQNRQGKESPANVFEARIFNGAAEMRWFNENGQGIAVILSETETDEEFGGEVLLENPQNYLFWGQSTAKFENDWTQFGTARIGSFYIPVQNIADRGFAKFTAIEYLKEFEAGNVAVFEERLTGISEVEK